MRVRRTSRLILLDEFGRVLLFKTKDTVVFRPNEPSPAVYWIAPGGSLEPGETHAAAARRELWEETGLEGIEPGPWVAVCEPVLNWLGEMIQAHDRFYLTPVRAVEVSLANMSDAERDAYLDVRWWRPDDLRTSGERVIPPGLPDILSRVAAGDIPTEPVKIV
jgi:8-oxo-dGTP pyrophosphatase MutT (NUDIX family)